MSDNRTGGNDSGLVLAVCAGMRRGAAGVLIDAADVVIGGRQAPHRWVTSVASCGSAGTEAIAAWIYLRTPRDRQRTAGASSNAHRATRLVDGSGAT